MKLRPSRNRRRGRIEIIPMIDVMFFLLATFMLASLTMQNLHSLRVDLPQGKAAPLTAAQSVTLTVTASGDLVLNAVPVTLDMLAAALKPLLGPDHRVVVALAGPCVSWASPFPSRLATTVGRIEFTCVTD